MSPTESYEGAQPEGIDAPAVFTVSLVTVVILTVLVVAAYEIGQRSFRTAAAEATEETGYPVLRSTRESGIEKLSTYAVVDAQAGRYRIPIDRAIDLMVNEASPSPDVSPEVRLTR